MAKYHSTQIVTIGFEMYKQMIILSMCEHEIRQSSLTIVCKQRILLEIFSARKRILINEKYEIIKSNDIRACEITDIYNQIKSICNTDSQELNLENNDQFKIIEELEKAKQTAIT